MQHKIQFGSLYNVMAYCTHVHGIFVTDYQYIFIHKVQNSPPKNISIHLYFTDCKFANIVQLCYGTLFDAYCGIRTFHLLHVCTPYFIAVDDASRQATAMAILVACMKCTSSEKDTNPLCYLYQEYKVNRG